MKAETEIYAIEWNGDCWQSVFPSAESGKSQLHTGILDAYAYIRHECGIKAAIVILPEEPDSAVRAVLQKAERFISGFEDDRDQEGVPELLADIRALLAAPNLSNG